jgi:transmembrane protein DUF3566
VTEAGKSAEPPLMAPPGRDAERDGLTEDTVPQSGLMSVPTRSASSRPGAGRPGVNGKEKPDAPRESSAQPPAPAQPLAPSSMSSASSTQVDVPFPADEIGVPKNPAGSVSSVAAAANPDSDHGGERLSGAAAALNGKLDSGRQAVRQAVAATNNWISSRTAKSDSPTEDDAGRPGASGAGASVDAEPETAGVSDTSSGPETVVSSATGTPTASSETAAAGAASAAGAVFGSAKSRPSFTPSAAPEQTYPPSRSSAGWSSAQQPAAVTVAPAPNREPDAKWRRDAVRRSRRQAHLTLARVEPWSVMKFSFVVSVVAFVILFVAIAVLYMVMSGLGVFTSLQHTVSTITSSQGSSGTNISSWFSASRILGYTGMLGALNIVLITAMSTIGAVIYNLIAHTIGGVEITLRETE